jgi:hypothetical protein
MRPAVVMICAFAGGACVSIPEFRGGSDGGTDGSAVDAPGVPCQQAIEIAGLLVHLPLDSIASGVTEDASANNHDGMVLGGAALGPGRRGMGIVLDGGSKAITLGSPTELDNLSALTVCAWLHLSRIDSANQGATIADKSTDGYVGGWNSYLDYDSTDSAVHVGYLAREGQWAYGQSPVPVATWTHACTAWGSNALTVYVNGSVDAILEMGTAHAPPADDDAANDLVLGRQTNTNQYNLNGTLDDFVLYGRALTASEIAAIHACK